MISLIDFIIKLLKCEIHLPIKKEVGYNDKLKEKIQCGNYLECMNKILEILLKKLNQKEREEFLKKLNEEILKELENNPKKSKNKNIDGPSI